MRRVDGYTIEMDGTTTSVDERTGERVYLEIHQRHKKVRVCNFSVNSGCLN